MKLITALLLTLPLIGCAVDDVDQASDQRLGGAPSSAASPAAEAAPELAIDSADNRYLQLVNQARSQPRHCGDTYFPAAPALSWDDDLNAAADSHSRDMAQHNFIEHTGSDGLRVGERLNAEGYPWQRAGENIAAGHASAEAAIRDWLDSPHHCRTLMDASFTQMGMAKASNQTAAYHFYRDYWTQVLARPR